MTEDHYEVTIDLTSNEMDVDWLRAARLMERCKAGDKIACDQLKAMEQEPLWPHDDVAAGKG